MHTYVHASNDPDIVLVNCVSPGLVKLGQSCGTMRLFDLRPLVASRRPGRQQQEREAGSHGEGGFTLSIPQSKIYNLTSKTHNTNRT